jgi:geranylgeranyl diphosphate synthase, type I
MQESAVTSEQVQEILAIFERTETQTYCRQFLAEQCRLAHEALANVPRNDSPIAARALHDMEQLVLFVQETARI